MDWKVVQNSDLPRIKDLILKREWANVSFSSRLKNYINQQNLFKSDCTILVHHDKERDALLEAIMLLRWGVILPLLAHFPLEEYSPVLRYYLSTFRQYLDQLHSIMGLYDDVVKIEAMLPDDASHHIDYYLMTVTGETLKPPDTLLFKDVIIKKASLKDADRLYELQKMYELEEVFIDPSKFNPKTCLSHLKTMLKDELIFYAEKNGIPAAKAGTNARGFITDQIGGVYTDYGERRKGLACTLMYEVLRTIFKTKKTASLFVKKNNTPAISLYRKLGFEIRENFRISYFFK